MTKPLEFWFEFASSYSYPAAMRVEAACAEAGVPLIWRPFLLGPVFAAQGLTDSPFMIYPVKGAYMWRDMERVCDDAEIVFHKPTRFPRGSLPAARITAHFAEAPWIGAFVRAVYHANFAEDRDIDTPEVVRTLLTELGQDVDAVWEAAHTPTAKGELRSLTDAAQSRGIFGAPSFTVETELFWGHDRMAQALRWAQAG